MSAAFLRSWRTHQERREVGVYLRPPPILETLTGATYTCKEEVSSGVQETRTV